MEIGIREYRKGGVTVNVCGGCKYEDREGRRTFSGPPPCLHPKAPAENPVHGCPLKVMR